MFLEHKPYCKSLQKTMSSWFATSRIACRLRELIASPGISLMQPHHQHNFSFCSPIIPQSFTKVRGIASFFGRYTAEALWKSATSVSNPGRKRGRARGRKVIKNLNRGQVLGIGECFCFAVLCFFALCDIHIVFR